MQVKSKTFKLTARVAAAVVGAASVLTCFVGCESPYAGDPDYLNDFADQIAILMMGDDAFAWNAFSSDPESTYSDYEIERGSTAGWGTWYSYSGTLDKTDIMLARFSFNSLYKEFNKFKEDRFSGVDGATYRSTKYMLDTYRNYYSSKNAADFPLISGSYVNSEGGYVADFATSFENFIFRDRTDVEILLDVTKDTKNAFPTYIAYASDRADNGYPLHDFSLNAMLEYLDDVLEQGDDYYLYAVAEKKIDAAEFLTEAQKSDYKTKYNKAITDYFMHGVKTLNAGLKPYLGKVKTTDTAYLASYDAVGREYYKWMCGMRTGNFDINIDKVYEDLVVACSEYYAEMDKVDERADALKTAEPEVYADYEAYKNGEKYMLGLTDPDDVLAYLKDAAKAIVPDLAVTPEIDFKKMDETVAGITNAMAYYVKSPLDEHGAAEHITLNPEQVLKDPSDLLTTVAHEGYPGHLYAHVKSKETGTRLISTVNSCLAFGEGWAQYVELALLDNIAASTDDKALALYAQYDKYQILAGYINSLIMDISINYYGLTATQLAAQNVGMTIDRARELVGLFMENPAAYVPYGYGMYFIYDLHNQAKTALGENYDEVEFNGVLLSEGFGPTLPRAQAITDEYIKNA